MSEIRLMLVRASFPVRDRSIPLREWKLAPKGIRASIALAEWLRPFYPAILLTSSERRAVETAHLAATGTNLRPEIVPGLDDNDRFVVPVRDHDEFARQATKCFTSPHSREFGCESAQEAIQPFEGALLPYLAIDRPGPVVTITGATVMALFAGRHGVAHPFLLWRDLGAPSIMIFRGRDLLFDTVINDLEADW